MVVATFKYHLYLHFWYLFILSKLKSNLILLLNVRRDYAHSGFMLLQFEKKNNCKAIERFCSIGLLQQTITWYMVVGKLIIIPALGHQSKGKTSFTGSGLFILVSQGGNNNQLAHHHLPCDCLLQKAC